MYNQFYQGTPDTDTTARMNAIKTAVGASNYLLATALPSTITMPIKGYSDPASIADVYRFTGASLDPNYKWFDSDVVINDLFIPKVLGKAYFSALAGIWAFDMNNDTAMMKQIATLIQQWRTSYVNGFLVHDCHPNNALAWSLGGFIREWLRTNPTTWLAIPDGYYTHLNLKSWADPRQKAKMDFLNKKFAKLNTIRLQNPEKFKITPKIITKKALNEP